jgi:hypothetical protein
MRSDSARSSSTELANYDATKIPPNSRLQLEEVAGSDLQSPVLFSSL